LFVLTRDGRAVFQSVGGALGAGEHVLAEVESSSLWWEHPHEGQVHRTYLVSDRDYIYALSYPRKVPLDHAAGLASFILLALVLGGVGLAALLSLSALGVPAGIHPRDLVSGIASSFRGKLYAAFVALALASIVSLAFLIRGIVIQDLQRDVEREALERALVAAQLVRDSHLSRPPSPLGMAPLTDSVLERVALLAGVDVDLYIGGELLATSKPELIASGLLGSRAAPAAQKEIVVDGRSHAVHTQSVGSFPYQVVSVPVVLEPWTEPAVLSIPQASRQPEIARRISSVNQTLLVSAAAFSAAAALLAYFLARGISGPIKELTDATHEVAEGSLDVALEARSRDEIGTLFASFSQMTRDLKRQRADLERTKKLEAWAEMARQVAHEIKNPLTPIQLNAEHLRRVHADRGEPLSPVLQECVATILTQVKLLRQIASEFSSFASSPTARPTEVDLAALLHETVDPYRSGLEGRIRFDVSISSALPPVLVDRNLVARSLSNIVENALHAMPGQGTLTVAARPGVGVVHVRVSDTGVGMDEEALARAFEPYFSTKASGTGLGLPIAKRNVELVGGTIAVTSVREQGTAVEMSLPIAPRGEGAGV
jgi:signal transduction histidine kinase